MNYKSYAKINLSLEILKKRNDGYHDIKSIFQLINLYDEISIEKNNTDSKVNISCDNPDMPLDESNLCHKAYLAMKPYLDSEFGLDIDIKKNIPMFGGLGGGSSNAATVLHFMNQTFHSPLSINFLIDIAKDVGADIPFFLAEQSAILVEGIGDKLTNLENTVSLPILLILPEENVSTVEAYNSLNLDELNLSGEKTTMIHQAFNLGFVKDGLKYSHNDFEKTVFEKYPILKQIKDELLLTSPITALMSGSGSSLYAVYETESKRDIGYSIMSDKYKCVKSELRI